MIKIRNKYIYKKVGVAQHKGNSYKMVELYDEDYECTGMEE